MQPPATEPPPANTDEFRLIADSAPVAVWVTRLDRQRSFVNRAYCAFLGLPYAEALAFDWRTIIHPADAPRVLAQSVAGEASLQPFQLEGRYRNAAGEWRWLHSTSAPRWDAEGRHIGFIGVAHDVTDAKRSEEALRRSEETLRLATETAGMATWELNLQTMRGLWSPNRFDLLGMARTADRTGSFEDWLARIHPQDRAMAEAHARRCFSDGTHYTIEYRIVRQSDGRERWLQSHGSRIDYADERPSRFVGVSFDITDRKNAEAELRASEARFRTIFEEANDFLVTTTLDQVITAVNPAVLAALGYHEDEVVGRAIADFLDDQDIALSRSALAQKLIGGGTTRLTLNVRARSGGRQIWEINARLATDAAGIPTGLHAIGRDVTEAKRHEAHLRLLIDELNHRVKNTLAIVQGIAQQSFKGDADPALAREAFEGRLAALSEAHNLLTRQHWGAVSMRQILADAVAPHGGDAGRFVLEGPDLTLEPKTAISLALVVHELTTNAVKHGSLSTPQGHVTIRWNTEEQQGRRRFRLVWTEQGGPGVTPPSRRGFGTRMIERGLAAELAGTVSIDFRSEGIVCTIDAPLPETAE